MSDFNKLLHQAEYYSLTDLRYSDSVGTHMSGLEIKELLDYKDKQISSKSDYFTKLNLKSFNSKYVFYTNHDSLYNLYDEYYQLINSDDVFASNLEEMRKARVYSELEGSMKIEGYNSTRQIYDRLMAGKAPENRDEIIIRNMAKALEFVDEGRPFTGANLFKLYSILAEDCLDKGQVLLPGEIYRHDMVYISNYNGAPVDSIKPCMDSMFRLVAQGLKSTDPLFRFLLPHIVHYYIVYIHPYFDCNGRTARMASLWVANLTGMGNSPYFISEAINDNKPEYYRALSRTRDSRNDLSYFLLYVLRLSVSYALGYRKLNKLRDMLAESGDSMTSAEYGYMKKIILSFDTRYFTWKEFVNCIGTNMSKQGALKTLNRLESDGLLVSGFNKKNEKIFKLF